MLAAMVDEGTSLDEGRTAAESPRGRIHDGTTHDLPMAAALDRSALRRMRAFHGFGIVAPLVTLLLSLRLGGDPLLHQLFCAGMVVLACSNIVMLVTLRRGE